MLATNAFNIVITITVILIIGSLIYLLIRLMLHNEARYREDKNILTADMIPNSKMKGIVDNYIARVGKFGSFYVMQIDIDNFKGLNELYGPSRCDQVLQELSYRITSGVEHSVVSHLNDDKIFVLVKDDVNYATVEEDVSNLIVKLKQTYENGHQTPVNLTVSVSIALYPTCGTTYKALLRSLELTNYVVKRNGGDNYMIYSSDIDSKETSNMDYFNEIRTAIDDGQFCLYYQPIIDIRQKKLLGFETFLRWNHPTQGVLTPDKFIKMLETSGDINYISKWGVEQIVTKMGEIQSHIGANDLIYTNNISTKQLMSDTLVEELKKLLHNTKANPHKIVLEIEDYMMYDKMDQVKLNLLRLRDLGFRISVDGLKLDYAALSQIEKEPIDIIKLDRSFLKDINNNKMKKKFVEMLVDSAEHMHRMVIAEGVEVYDHILYLEKNNIQYGQGYYFSKPFEDKFVYEFIVNKDFEDKLDLKHANLVANNLSEAKEVETLQEKANTQKQVDDEGSSDNITM